MQSPQNSAQNSQSIKSFVHNLVKHSLSGGVYEYRGIPLTFEFRLKNDMEIGVIVQVNDIFLGDLNGINKHIGFVVEDRINFLIKYNILEILESLGNVDKAQFDGSMFCITLLDGTECHIYSNGHTRILAKKLELADAVDFLKKRANNV